MSIINNLYSKYGHVMFIFIITITVASIFSIFGVDAHHQGIMFKPALDVAHGQMLFRDTFTQYGAMTTLLHALVLKLFGDHLLLIQIQTAIFYGFISICLWYLWRPFLSKWLTTVSVLIWLFIAPYFVWTMLPWSSVPALLFQLLSLLIIFMKQSSAPVKFPFLPCSIPIVRRILGSSDIN